MAEKSSGLGDSIEKFTKATGIKKAVEVVTKAVGIEDCGCTRRKEQLNKLVTYKNSNIEPTTIEEPINEGDTYLVLGNITNMINNQESRILKDTILIVGEKNKIEIEGYLLAGLLKKL